HPTTWTTGNNITVTYTGPVLHQRGEPVYVSDGAGGFIVSNYTNSTTPVLTRGDEAYKYRGGEQAYYATNDQKVVATTEYRRSVPSYGATGHPTGTTAAGTTWALSVGGTSASCVALDGDTLTTVAGARADAVNTQLIGFRATVSGSTITITQKGGASFTASF